ncbi:NAD(P)H-dependent glycerol-3-phosphate dehydrogenase [Pinisolibacter aquiterrae]|uniref:NAD(P)H-dependent glycerol-3-phosphate dehydrogenase n=1 Tax=Pinisolibacter aquiterrae TaxID=2815579 RepID=UPI001C3E3845|nr:NAD(P)H-dependent glycerol-3-phosphate dehydrogenase [Pinisolibacter aquiterrae]MBV5266209.1 NAD(P)-dependent glycerol-3-phosphate dehydrogenase [Pinisolibacter aquiterrae]MCC8236297.1 NAD(P)-dependent glycerol-3-phosphate dehydrogenase [Pinisolibacter aquiterrae]
MSERPAIERVAVIGAGAWGTALALVAARAGREVRLYGRDPETVAAIGEEGRNPRYLGDIRLEPGLYATTDAAHALDGAQLVILSVPAQATRASAGELAGLIAPGTPVVSAAKGLEHGTRATMTDVIAAAMPNAVAGVLSGPSFAVDVARGLPTAVTVAAKDDALAEAIARALSSSTFRPYASHDLIGVQVGGALKNVLAIASGIVVGRGLGASAQAATTARGFAELTRLARALGAEAETLMGLSGLGDLVLTATSPQSRNFSLGVAIGAGGSIADLTRRGTKLAEGVHTASVAVEFAASHGVELPITAAVADVVAETIGVDGAIDRLMSRPLKREVG